jgi:hypothetical protein
VCRESFGGVVLLCLKSVCGCVGAWAYSADESMTREPILERQSRCLLRHTKYLWTQ